MPTLSFRCFSCSSGAGKATCSDQTSLCHLVEQTLPSLPTALIPPQHTWSSRLTFVPTAGKENSFLSSRPLKSELMALLKRKETVAFLRKRPEKQWLLEQGKLAVVCKSSPVTAGAQGEGCSPLSQQMEATRLKGWIKADRGALLWAMGSPSLALQRAEGSVWAGSTGWRHAGLSRAAAVLCGLSEAVADRGTLQNACVVL